MNIGDKAPEVLGKDEQGREIRLSDYKGRKLVLYFYPKDNTGGCTAEACSLRDRFGELQGQGYEVVGVSKDSAASHVKFKEKHNLPFPLIADVSHELLETMGAWGEKTMYGKKVMGTIRTTFIINEEGIIEQIFAGKQVKTKEHAEQILERSLSPALP
ncbi:MAG: thioredoxin-dependent thiol peroxidase [Paludibacteraceae bacterium]|nr:thioredoxin-dependent thiol peroxidase [Paludibacteraceae bacterium]